MEVFSVHTTGYSHLLRGAVCQDRTAAFRRCYAGVEGVATVLLVSDGHGHSDYYRSDRGASFALQAASEALEVFAAGLQRGEGYRDFYADIISRWNALVARDLEVDPTGSDDPTPYGCTLLGAVGFSDGWTAFAVGDGMVAALSDGRVYPHAVPPDPRCQGCLTTSLLGAAVSDFRTGTGEGVPEVMLAATDGLVNSFVDEADCARQILPALREETAGDFRRGCAKIVEILPQLSRAGSRDDIGLAFWIK